MIGLPSTASQVEAMNSISRAAVVAKIAISTSFSDETLGRIYDAIKNRPITCQQIVKKTGISESVVRTVCRHLDRSGAIKNVSTGNKVKSWVRSSKGSAA